MGHTAMFGFLRILDKDGTAYTDYGDGRTSKTHKLIRPQQTFLQRLFGLPPFPKYIIVEKSACDHSHTEGQESGQLGKKSVTNAAS
jgi:hypothetical protein